MNDNVNAGGSAIFIRENLQRDLAVVTHEITCQGRDHIVRIQSGDSVLVIINVHFEPDLTLRNLRERLRRITFHWPRYREGVGMIIGDFNNCECEKGRFNVRNQTFTEGDAGKMAFSSARFSHTLLKLRNQTLQGRILLQTVRYALYPELTERSLMCPWLKRGTFTATLM